MNSISQNIVFDSTLTEKTGTIKGVVLTKDTNEPVPFANVVVEKDGIQQGGSQTDFDGNYLIKKLEPGIYILKASFIGLQSAQVNDIEIAESKTTLLDVKLHRGNNNFIYCPHYIYCPPLIDISDPSTKRVVESYEIRNSPYR